jgi:hypothetical protein
MVQTELGKLISRLGKNSRISLMFNPLWNSITSSTVGVWLFLVTRSECKGYRPPRSSLFVLEVTISLSEQFSSNSNLKWNLQLFQCLWGFAGSCNNKKWSKLDLLSPQIFLCFPMNFWTPNKFSSNSKSVCFLRILIQILLEIWTCFQKESCSLQFKLHS